jgi:photosystem II stability/assembly factor-like uncharacterized protein
MNFIIKYRISIFLFLLLINSRSIVSAQDFWQEMTPPDSVGNAYSINFNSLNEVFISTINGVFKSNDNGESWDKLASFTIGNIEISSNDELFAGFDFHDRLYYSNSNGQTWDTIQMDIEAGGRMKLIEDSILFSLGWGYIRKSSDGGHQWTEVITTTPSECFTDVISKDGIFYTGSIAFMPPNNSGIRHSLDKGNSWEHISLTSHGISSFDIDLENNLLCSVDYDWYGFDVGVFHSLDNGFNWENILPGYTVTCLSVDLNGGIYVGCSNDSGTDGIHFSPDMGISWEPLNSGMHEDASITRLAISPSNYVYTTTDAPVKLYRSINPIVVIGENHHMIREIQVFPNPFSNRINIAFPSEHFQDITIKLISQKGQTLYENEMESIKNERLIEVKSLNFISPGIYQIVIQSNGSIIDSKTIIKIKE